MSEFKFACPVCGQHIKCDSSQAGTVMDCPTCFQKINVPQAPTSADQKFILTGTKVGEKRPPTLAETSAHRGPILTGKGLPIAAVALVVVFILAAGAGVYFFGGKILHLGSKWEAADVGPVGAAGTFGETGDTVTIAGSGADIWGLADAFHFAYQPAQGDVSVMVHVEDMQNTDPWAKAGVMIRESLDASSAYAELVATPKNGVGFQLRASAGAPASSAKLMPRLHAPCWLRLTRRDNAFTAETSPDGAKWSSAGITTVAMKADVYAGLAVCSHKSGTLCQAIFDNALVSRGGGPAAETPKAGSNTAPAPAQQPPAPKPAAPPVNDSNWTLVLRTNVIADDPVAGRIHGQPFLMERASFQGGSLTLRTGTKGPVELGVVINFGGAQAEELTGKTINVTTNVDKAAKISLRYLDDSGNVQKPAFDSGYALRLEFGLLANNHLPGKIYLCLPDDEKSYVTGSFVAGVSKPKPKPNNQQK